MVFVTVPFVMFYAHCLYLLQKNYNNKCRITNIGKIHNLSKTHLTSTTNGVVKDYGGRITRSGEVGYGICIFMLVPYANMFM